ncbi:hypothetical protein SO802_020125 [Lithocarpus litseifolius]|uniref:Uncharacterized protein n=1 Tax=Lithocarpus litseifolius TaxID=425828 RepID=A0AAW2CB22_9ROSI
MTLKAKSNETDESSDDEDSKMKSYITRQFKKFIKNDNVKGFDKDRKQSSSSQFKSQDRGKKDAKDGDELVIEADGATGLDDVLASKRDDGRTSGARISRLEVT